VWPEIEWGCQKFALSWPHHDHDDDDMMIFVRVEIFRSDTGYSLREYLGGPRNCDGPY
jgi:hypothetical protein